MLGQALPAIGHVLDRAIFPRWCLVCGEAAREPGVCVTCLKAMAGDPSATCRRCALPWPKALESGLRPESIRRCPRCLGRAQSFDAAVALGPYRDALRSLCLALKKPYQAWLAATLAGAVVDRHEAWIESWLAAEPPERDAVVAGVPLHWRRRWSRGYDQADALTSAVARRLGLARVRPLRRVRATPQLAPMGAVRRKAMLRRAFVIRRCAPAAVRGRDVVLVDDIMTSGATCGAAARQLRRAGARRVIVVVVARAEASGR